MEATERTWAAARAAVGAGALCLAVVWAGSHWPLSAQTVFDTPSAQQQSALLLHPLVQVLKLIAAAVIGLVITAVHKRYHRDKPLTRSLQQAQVLLCIAGAMVMIIIGDSVARAFGVGGAAAVVRFRTPVEDPKDTTLLFLLITLGMACGIGQFAVAGLGTVFLCLILLLLDRVGEAKQRTILLSLVAPTREFPTEHVQAILSSSVDFYEPREVLQGSEAVVKYHVTLDPQTSLSWLSQQLMGAGLKSVAWGEPTKKGG